MIGLVVNPVAGVGGPAGLAGSDGADVQQLARQRGAMARSAERAAKALAVIATQYPSMTVLTASGGMGERAVQDAGLAPRVVFAAPETTSPADTRAAVAALADAGATLVLFVGGDGTARDVVSGLADRAEPPAVIGVPAGVKMYSPVFAVGPSAAGALAADWISAQGLPVAEREVLDIDEDELRRTRVQPRLYGMLRVPVHAARTQARKAATPVSEAAAVASAARGVIARMQHGVRYLLGPGGTTAEIARQLGITGTALGVDVVCDGTLLIAGASEAELLAEVQHGPAKAVVTVIGGQGFLLGRGNQQLSASVIRALGADPLIVVAPEQKLLDLHGRALIVDTGDAELDATLAGHVHVVTGAHSVSLYAVTAPELQNQLAPA